jgi:hypothetical protein
MKVAMNDHKQMIVEQLKKTPIVQVVCEKVGVGRSTYYRWRSEDAEFKKQTDLALKEGFLLVNDLAESQLVGAIRDRNLTAIIYWLKHHHPIYENRLEITHKQDRSYELSEEEAKVVQQALALMSSGKEQNA